MRKIVIFMFAVFCMFTAVSCASLSSTDIGPYQEILTVEGETKEEIYTRAQSWFVDSFVDSSKVIELQDKESGTIKGKYTMTIPRNPMCELVLESVITVEVKDGRVRFTVSSPVNGYARVGYNQTGITGYTSGEVEKINAERASLFDSFKSYITAGSVDEW